MMVDRGSVIERSLALNLVKRVSMILQSFQKHYKSTNVHFEDGNRLMAIRVTHQNKIFDSNLHD